ncbi:ribosomal RNA small subunit methyltransferase C [Acinetobacter vivianii]|jgi:16S rRNA G1207 methylase RsmC|uniref:Ribosomal RNA small subunit methyltransferase C n=1 Tax=Acinetobacter vivianii TaxID=1776742 RepID=N9PZC2_9GAMM|nr:methyltransferase [Acinetobacter vivianii]ENX20097.1 ribosomal RNA small subunit methyltransferase C [Acinetobacter vivianii]GGI59455.1 ribosomal RNA small subunit methyltransferase C [Acinetobacter vivianii]
MDPRSEVVIRQQDYLNGHVLLINAPNDQLAKNLPDQVQASVWTWNYADHQGFQNSGIHSHFSVEFPQASFDQVVIFVPKSKELLNYILHVVVSHLKLGQNVFLVGEKKGGVERAAKQLQPYGKTLKLDSARHCQFWQMKIEKTEQLKPLEHWLKSYTVQIDQDQLKVCALPGVFSQDHLDVGTAVLVPYLSQVKSGKIADFGCGAGIISAYLAKLNQNQQIFALDVDAFALRSTELTFQKNNLDLNQLTLQPVTGFRDAPKDLDAIVSNPPFHQGIHTNYDASEELCQLASVHLKNSGELWIVANRFLNYPPLIEQSFGQCMVKADQQGFKVLYACAK